MEPTLFRWWFKEIQPRPLDVSDGRHTHWSIPRDRMRDPGRYFVGTWKSVTGPRGVPGFLKQGDAVLWSWR